MLCEGKLIEMLAVIVNALLTNPFPFAVWGSRYVKSMCVCIYSCSNFKVCQFSYLTMNMRKEENTNLMAPSMLRLTHFRSQCSVSRQTYTHLGVHITTFVMSYVRQSSRQLRHTPPMIRVTTIHAHLLIQADLRCCQAVTHFKAAHSTLTIPSASHFN